MKDYYKILRISRSASAAEIKRAFRRLAVVFHPDKNPSQQSSALFQEINEANQVLSDPVKRALYDQMLSGGSATVDVPSQPRQHRDPAYRKRQQPGYRPRPAQPSEKLLMMAHLLKYYRWVVFAGLGWCGILVLDYILPFRMNKENIISESEAIDLRATRHSAYVIFTNYRHQFPVDSKGVVHFAPGTEATVVTSRIMNLLVRVDAQDKEYSITTLGTVYQTFMFMPIVLFILSLIALQLKTGIEYRFSFMVAICTVMFFNAIFLAVSIL